MTDRLRSSSPCGGFGSLLLRVARPNGRIDEVYLEPGQRIGRTGANNIVVDDETVDRVHALVEGTDQTSLWVRCVSPTGTITLDGHRVREVLLAPGVEFRIGATRFACAPGRPLVSGTRPEHCPFCQSREVPLDGESPRPCPECGRRLLPVSTGRKDASLLLVPTDYERYQAQHFVAAGGMAVILKGARLPDQRPVAIKVILPEDGFGRSGGNRFRNEIELMRRIRHPNVVRLMDYGTAGELDFLMMEWVEGASLREIIAGNRSAGANTGFETALDWLLQVCRGLEAIHAQGVIHRDVKPANIMIARDGHAQIVDLGIAKEIQGTTAGLTSTGIVAGTIVYMAPEQITAPESVDHRADLYSLGATFYELLTGTAPFGAWYPASTLNLTVPSDFDRILSGLLAPDPSKRISSAGDVIAHAERVKGARRPISNNRPTDIPADKAIIAAKAVEAGRVRVDDGANIKQAASKRNWSGPQRPSEIGQRVLAKAADIAKINPSVSSPPMSKPDLLAWLKSASGVIAAVIVLYLAIESRYWSESVDKTSTPQSQPPDASSDRRLPQTKALSNQPLQPKEEIPPRLKPDVDPAPSSPSLPVPPLPTAPAPTPILDQAGQTREDNFLNMKLIWCPAGSLKMGSAPGEKDRMDNEIQADVTITTGFWIGKYEVTQVEWRKLIQTAPGEAKGTSTKETPAQRPL